MARCQTSCERISGKRSRGWDLKGLAHWKWVPDGYNGAALTTEYLMEMERGEKRQLANLILAALLAASTAATCGAP